VRTTTSPAAWLVGRDGEFFEEAERVVENDYAVGFVVSGAGDLNLANTMSAQPRQDMFLHLDFYIDRLVTGLSYEHNQVFGQIEIKSRTWLTPCCQNGSYVELKVNRCTPLPSPAS
jgi:hypothetical protein